MGSSTRRRLPYLLCIGVHMSWGPQMNLAGSSIAIMGETLAATITLLVWNLSTEYNYMAICSYESDITEHCLALS